MASRNMIDDEVLEMEDMQEEKPEVLFIRLVDRKLSGFIQDLNGKPAASKGTDFYHEFDAPVARFIPTFGMRRGYKVEVRNGKKVKTAFDEPIYYLKGNMEISVERQIALGVNKVNMLGERTSHSKSNKDDLIEVKRGEFSVVREGSWISLFDYLKTSYYNKSNPDRGNTRASAIYEEVEVGKEEEELNEYDLHLAYAIRFIGGFYQRGPKGFTYKEDRIMALCELFAIYADSMAGRITALNGIAKIDPKKFLEKAERFEQTNQTNVAHALQLNLIRFNGNIAEYVEKEKLLANLGEGKFSHDKKIELLSNLLQNADYKAVNEEFLFELEVAKENQSLK